MKPLWRGVLTGAVAYLVFLVATAPAATLLPLAQDRMQNVRMAGVEGSLWSGQAALLDAAPVQLTGVRWRLRPLALFTGHVEFAVEGQLQGQTVQANAGSSFFGTTYLAAVKGRVAAVDVLRWFGVKQVAVEGNLDIDLEEVEWSEASVPAVAGTIAWSPARVVSPVELTLGTAQLDTQVEDGSSKGKLQASGGDLLVEADVEMNPSGSYRLAGDIQQKGDVPQAVEKFLSTFAEYKDGRYRLEWSDSL